MDLIQRFGISEPELRARGWALLRPCTLRLQCICAEHEPVLKSQAAVALGKIGDPSSLDVLAGLLEHDEELAEDAATALARLSSPDVVGRLLSVVSATTPRVQAAVARALAGYREPGVVGALLPLLGSSHENVRKAALGALGALADPSARAAVIAAFDDPDPDTAVEAVRAFVCMGLGETDEALSVLEPLYGRAVESRVKASVVAAFQGRSGDRLVAFEKKALRDPNPRVRANAVEVLGAAGIPERRLMSILKPMIQEGENNRVLANLAIALGAIDPDTTLGILSRLLNSPEKWERASAVYAARFVRNDRVASWLTTLFTSEEDPDVLRNILESLAQFEAEDVSACFVKALEHGNPLVRSGAAKSLGRIHDTSLQTKLVELLEREKDTNVICEILSALGTLADASRIPLVAQYLQHTDIRVQANAIEALESIGTVEIVPFVEPFLNSSDNRVKANAAVALWSQGSLDVVDALREMLGHTNLKQRSSAIYAVGELGEALRRLGERPEKYYVLISALKEEDFSHEDPPAPAPAAVAVAAVDPEAASHTARYDFAQVLGALPAAGDADDFPLAEIEEYFALLAQRRVKEALAFLKASLDTYPGNRLLLYLRADAFRLQKALSRACEGFREITKDPRDSLEFINPHIHLANIYSQSHELPQSLEAYFTAAKAQLAVLAREIDMGLDMLREKRIDEASLLLKELISAAPLNSRLHYAAGRSFLKGKYNDDAFRHLRLAYLLNPNNGEVLLSLTFACYKTRRYAQVRLLASKLARLFGDASPLTVKAVELVDAMDRAGV